MSNCITYMLLSFSHFIVLFGCIFSFHPRLAMLHSQCCSNGPGNLGNLGSIKEIASMSLKVHTRLSFTCHQCVMLISIFLVSAHYSNHKTCCCIVLTSNGLANYTLVSALTLAQSPLGNFVTSTHG